MTFGRTVHLGLRDRQGALPRPRQTVLRTQEELEASLTSMRRADSEGAPQSADADELPSPSPAPSPPTEATRALETQTEAEVATETLTQTPTETLTQTPTEIELETLQVTPEMVVPRRMPMECEKVSKAGQSIGPYQDSQAGPSRLPCIICERKAHLQCCRCGGACYDTIPCGERVGGDTTCTICLHDVRSSAERRGAQQGLQKQAEKMLLASAKIDSSPPAVGDNVRVGITYLDQARNQPPNVIAVVLVVSWSNEV